MPPTAQHALIEARLFDQLSAIDSSALPAVYHYTPQGVARVDEFKIEYLRDEMETVYLIRPSLDTLLSRNTCLDYRQVEVFVLGARKWKETSVNPHIETLPRSEVQSRLEEDIKTCVRQDYRLGGLSYDVQVPDVQYEFDVEGTFQWAVVEVRVLVSYEDRRRLTA